MSDLKPALAAVRPRARDPEMASSRLLEEIVEERAEASPQGILWLVGETGIGKTVALAHLSATFADSHRYKFIDDAEYLDKEIVDGRYSLPHDDRLVIAARKGAVTRGQQFLQLEMWGEDELVEYLLSTHRAHCGDVIRRLGEETQNAWLPRLASLVIDQMVNDLQLTTADDALRNYLRQQLPHRWQRRAARKLCLIYQKGGNKSYESLFSKTKALPQPVKKLLRHAEIQLPLAAEEVAQGLAGWRPSRVLQSQLSLGLVEATGKVCRDREDFKRGLEKILISRRRKKNHSMAASILLAADEYWRPQVKMENRDLSGAYFSGTDWPEISFARTQLQLAEFFEANLQGACFDEAILVETDFGSANLQLASFIKAHATGADFQRADLHSADLSSCNLKEANFDAANLGKANLFKAYLRSANLSNANLQESRLNFSTLIGANLTNADLTKCDMTRVAANQVDFRTTVLQQTCFDRADVSKANFDNVSFEGARFCGARLNQTFFTGSCLAAADFRKAYLVKACLGEIDWEHADLREANLSGATFHMGSSRSGLVGSPIASEGSRTGFYTDDLEELYYKAPELVRKANLCFADLRGANLTGVDLYLVDLRGAKLDREQYEQARYTGAILADSS